MLNILKWKVKCQYVGTLTTWGELLRKDQQSKGLDRQAVHNYDAWHGTTWWQILTHVNMNPDFHNNENSDDDGSEIGSLTYKPISLTLIKNMSL